MIVKQIRKLDDLAFRAAALIVLGAVFSFGYSLVEGRINPVMGQLTISHLVEAPPFLTTFDGEAVKLRDCDWVESRWYIGRRDGMAVATLWEYAGPPRIRESGDLEWISQTVRMARGDLLNNSFADVVHNCPWQPWATVTPFYTATGELK